MLNTIKGLLLHKLQNSGMKRVQLPVNQKAPQSASISAAELRGSEKTIIFRA